jgi:hypothetical protein
MELITEPRMHQQVCTLGKATRVAKASAETMNFVASLMYPRVAPHAPVGRDDDDDDCLNGAVGTAAAAAALVVVGSPSAAVGRVPCMPSKVGVIEVIADGSEGPGFCDGAVDSIKVGAAAMAASSRAASESESESDDPRFKGDEAESDARTTRRDAEARVAETQDAETNEG